MMAETIARPTRWPSQRPSPEGPFRGKNGRFRAGGLEKSIPGSDHRVMKPSVWGHGLAIALLAGFLATPAAAAFAHLASQGDGGPRGATFISCVAAGAAAAAAPATAPQGIFAGGVGLSLPPTAATSPALGVPAAPSLPLPAISSTHNAAGSSPTAGIKVPVDPRGLAPRVSTQPRSCGNGSPTTGNSGR
jgi:hypothetical protein